VPEGRTEKRAGEYAEEEHQRSSESAKRWERKGCEYADVGGTEGLQRSTKRGVRKKKL